MSAAEREEFVCGVHIGGRPVVGRRLLQVAGWVAAGPAQPVPERLATAELSPERVWMYPVVSVLDRDRYGQEIAAWTAKAKLRSDVSPGPGLRNRDPVHVSSPLPEPVRRGARP